MNCLSENEKRVFWGLKTEQSNGFFDNAEAVKERGEREAGAKWE